MSRFSHLEFEDPRKVPQSKTFGAPARDAYYFHEQGQKAFLNGDFEVALREYSRCLEQNAAFLEGWLGQALMLIELEEYREALLWADKALELFPENPQLLAVKAIASIRNGDVGKALAYTDNALSRKGNPPIVWLARTEVLIALQSVAVDGCIKNALSSAGATAPVVELAVGRLLLNSKDWPSALTHLRTAAQALPAAALAWLELGRCQAALGFPEAAASLQQCLALRPNWKQAITVKQANEKRGFFGRLFRSFRR